MARLRRLSCVNANTVKYISVMLFAVLWSSTGWTYDAKFQVHGFVSQAYLKTKSNNFFGVSTGRGTTDFRELGANVSVRPLASLQSAAQVLYREAGETDPGEFRLDFALIDYRPFTNEVFDAGLRVGRIKNPVGFYNDTRDVAFTRPGIILPQSIYFDRVRDLGLSSDGIQLYGDLRMTNADISLQFQIAQPRLSNNTEVALFSRDMPGELKANYSYIGKIGLDLFAGRIKFAYSGIALFADYESLPVEPVSNASFIFYPQIVSAQLNYERLSVTGEYARRPFKFSGMSAYMPFSEITGESYYLQLAVFLTQQMRAIARYDVAYLDVGDREGTRFAEITKNTRPAYSQFCNDISIGLQWEIQDRWLVMLEQHWINGTAWLPTLDNPDISASTEDWWMLGALLSFRF